MDRLLMTSLRRLLLVAATSGNNLGERTIIGNPVSFKTNVEKPLKEMLIPFAPVQDLHGYANPWPSGGGKNKMSLSSISLNRDTRRNISANIDAIPAGTYIVSWEYSGTSSNTSLIFRKNNSESGQKQISVTGAPQTVTFDEAYNSIYAFIAESQPSGATAEINNIMVRLASDTDATFAPYSNICPISGWTGVNISRCGKNLWNKDVGETGYFNSDGSIHTSNVWKYQYVKVSPNTAYTISGISSAIQAVNLVGFNQNKEFVANYGIHGNMTFTTTNDTEYIGLCLNTNTELNNPFQLELGSSATEYEPYTDGKYPVVFPTLGKNLLPNVMPTITKNGVIATKNADGTYTINTENGGATAVTDLYINSDTGNGEIGKAIILPNGDYKLNGITGGSNSTYRLYAALYKEGASTTFVGTNDGDATVSVSEGKRVGVFLRVFQGAVISNLKVSPMLRSASVTDATFEPFTNTAYSGTLDVTTGELVVDCKQINTSDRDWTYNSSAKYLWTSIPEIKRGTANVVPALLKSDTYFADAPNNVPIASGKNGAMSVGVSNPYLMVRDDRFNDATSFKQNSNASIVYEIATPLVFHLTPVEIQTLIGDNTVWTDTNGENTVKYLKKG